MHKARPKKKLGVMEKRIPTNPKFKNVQSKLDTGKTVDKVRLISHKEHLKRRDEAFYRITPLNLSELFEEYEDTGAYRGPEMVAKMVKSATGNYAIEREPESNNQGPRIVTYEEDENVQEEFPYLILDVRSREEFKINRIHRAQSFPAAHVNRENLHPDLYKFKNKDNTLIVFYENEERLASQTATALSEKGYNNIFVLAGGLLEFSARKPAYVEGQLPTQPKAAAKPSRRGSRDAYKVPSALSSTGGFSRRGSASGRNKSSISDVDSVMSNLTVAESVISRASARKNRTQVLH